MTKEIPEGGRGDRDGSSRPPGRIIEQPIVSDGREAGRRTRRSRSWVQLEHGRAFKGAERTRL